MPFLRSALQALLVVVAVAAGQSPSFAEERQVPRSRADVLLSFAPVAKRAQPAVVNVYASRTDKRPRNPLFDDPIFRRFFGDGPGPRAGGPTAQSLGSGVIVDPSGLVVTNVHVIEGMTDVRVALSDKREFDASILLADKRTDLAVLKLKGTANLPVMELGDSDAIEVGDIVLALGDPFGVGQTVTQGIISGLARTQIGSSGYQFFIQTDAAINPGNSGGALVDMNARLIGINSAIYSQSGGSIGIGFAIPVNMVKSVVAAARAGETRVRRPWLGASLQPITRDIAEGLGLDRPGGALVADVLDSGPAAAAGIKRGDVIVAVEGQAVDDPEALGYRLATKPLGGATMLTVRRDGHDLQLSLKLMAAPEIPPRDPVTLKGNSPFAGATIVNNSPAVAEDFSLSGTREGVVVTDVEDGSAAAAYGVQKGDVLLQVNDAKITSTKALERAAAARTDYWRVTIERAGQTITSDIGG
ncbi:MAG TPA: DegQ family serine endoprotease [Lichenihabitans sp.]|jgi:Do/DeqQ family serine protease|nr:DegQ family serine endoprotease [Lichenihabitans sp.]